MSLIWVLLPLRCLWNMRWKCPDKIRKIYLKLNRKILTKVKDLGVGRIKVVIKPKPWYFPGRNVRQRKGIEQGWNSVAYQPEEAAWMASPSMRGERQARRERRPWHPKPKRIEHFRQEQTSSCIKCRREILEDRDYDIYMISMSKAETRHLWHLALKRPSKISTRALLMGWSQAEARL